MEQDNTARIEQKLDYLIDEVVKVRHLVRLVVKERSTGALEIIEDLVSKTPGMAIDINRIQRHLQKSRPWTLHLMRRASLLNPNLKFIKGDSASNTPSKMVLVKKADLQHYDKISKLLEKHESVTMGMLKRIFDIEKREARLMADTFCEHYSEYRVSEDECLYGTKSFEDGICIKKKPVNSSVNC